MVMLLLILGQPKQVRLQALGMQLIVPGAITIPLLQLAILQIFRQ